MAGERLGLRLDSYPGHAGIIARTRHVTIPGLRHVARFWGHRGSFYEDDEPVADLLDVFSNGKKVVTGPSVDDYDPEADHRKKVKEISDQLVVEHAEVFRRLAESDAAESPVPAAGTGWCAPSP